MMSHSSTMSHHHSKLSPAQRAGWMPRDLAALGHFLDHIIDKVEEEAWTKVVEQRKAAKGKTWQDSVHELQELLERDSCARMLLHRAIDQAPRDLVDQANFLTSTEQLLRVIDHIITTAPVYAHDLLVGFPLNALLALLMGTPAGEEAFRHPELNRKFKGILDEWCRFLDSKASRYTLQTWLTDEAVEELHMEDYQWDENDRKYGGFKSWNDFFTRQLADNARPIDNPDDTSIVTSACDSTVIKISRGVRTRSKFWVKSQPYSILDILGPGLESYAGEFAGGDVYQAFLSAKKYHRWHSPVSGHVVKATNVDGTYYASLDGAPNDQAPPDGSQAYITHIAARAVYLIRADDPFGLMAFVPVGMAEVSSNCIDPKLSEASEENPVRVGKGEQLGMFKYGGSTHLLIFRPGVIERFEVSVGADVHMGKMIAKARTAHS